MLCSSGDFRAWGTLGHLRVPREVRCSPEGLRVQSGMRSRTQHVCHGNCGCCGLAKDFPVLCCLNLCLILYILING